MMELPKDKIKASRKNPKLFLMFSKPKVGKTTLLSQLEDNSLIIDTEEGSDYVDAVKIQVHNLEELSSIGRQILDAGRPYKYIAIDVLDSLELWAEERATLDYKRTIIGKNFDGDSILELPKGAGYLYLRITFFKIIDYICTLADNIILVGHMREASIEKAGKEVVVNDLHLTGKIKTMLASRSDAIGYLFRQDGKLMITFETRDEVTCGSRCENLKGQTFEFDWKKIYIE